MAELIANNLAPIMFAALVVFLLLGYPVAFSLAAVGIFYALVGINIGLLLFRQNAHRRSFCA